MTIRKVAAVLALVALAACDSESATDPTVDGNANVAGTWRGSVTAIAGGESKAFPVDLVLTQNGTVLTGTMRESGNTQDAGDPIAGTVSGNTVTIVGTPTPPAPCPAHHYTIVFNATTTTLAATGASGQVCDDEGPAVQLRTLTGASGSLSKQ